MTIWTKYAQATALRWTSHEDTADRRRKKRKEHHGPTLDISRYPAHFIAVCDDIWHGGEDYRDWTEVYVRGLADICQGLAAEFDVVCEMTAGLPHLWKGELPRV